MIPMIPLKKEELLKPLYNLNDDLWCEMEPVRRNYHS